VVQQLVMALVVVRLDFQILVIQVAQVHLV
jgi:hypothetical protein